MDNTKKIELTAEGRQKLIDELAYREGEKHDEIVERIKEARGFGDLSENSEYDAAKEEQSKNESRINEIRQILSMATVVEDQGHALTVSIGTTVELEDEKGKKRHEVMTFDKADEAYAYVKEIGLDKVYKDVTGGMPWENHGQVQEADKPANQNAELANLLREVLANDRKAA